MLPKGHVELPNCEENLDLLAVRNLLRRLLRIQASLSKPLKSTGSEMLGSQLQQYIPLTKLTFTASHAVCSKTFRAVVLKPEGLHLLSTTDAFYYERREAVAPLHRASWTAQRQGSPRCASAATICKAMLCEEALHVWHLAGCISKWRAKNDCLCASIQAAAASVRVVQPL